MYIKWLLTRYVMKYLHDVTNNSVVMQLDATSLVIGFIPTRSEFTGHYIKFTYI